MNTLSSWVVEMLLNSGQPSEVVPRTMEVMVSLFRDPEGNMAATASTSISGPDLELPTPTWPVEFQGAISKVPTPAAWQKAFPLDDVSDLKWLVFL